MLSAAAAYRLSGTQVWEVFPRQGADVLYDFDYSQAGGPTVIEELAYRLAQARHKYARCTRTRHCRPHLLPAIMLHSLLLNAFIRSPRRACQR